MKTLLLILVGALMLPTTLSASDYIVVRLYDYGTKGCIVISRAEAEAHKIAHLPRGIVIKYHELKTKYGVTSGSLMGMPVDDKDLVKYLDPVVAGK